MSKKPTTYLIAILLVGLCLLFSGCRRSELIPAAARQAVEDRAQEVYIESYSGDIGFEQVSDVQFSRAWRAKNLPEGLSSAGNDVQVWCIELTISGKRQGADVSEKPVWIAIQVDPNGEWAVQPLVLFSSIWPYESCGRAP